MDCLIGLLVGETGDWREKRGRNEGEEGKKRKNRRLVDFV
jgi:hypothetical protein